MIGRPRSFLARSHEGDLRKSISRFGGSPAIRSVFYSVPAYGNEIGYVFQRSDTDVSAHSQSLVFKDPIRFEDYSTGWLVKFEHPLTKASHDDSGFARAAYGTETR